MRITGPDPGALSSSATIAARLLGGLARAVDGLGHALAQRPVVVDAGEPEVGEGQAAEAVDGVVGRDRADLHGVEQPAEGELVHGDSMLRRAAPRRMRRSARLSGSVVTAGCCGSVTEHP